MKALIRSLLRVLFGFEAYHEEVLKTPGPVLLVPNHSSWLDWLFLGVCLDEDWRFVVSSVTAQTSWIHRKLMLNRRTFPIDTSSPYAVKRMAEYLQTNGRLVLFAEGRISRTGCLMKLFEGTGFLLHKTSARIITAYLRNAHRLPSSPNPNRKVWFPKITVHFSDVLTAPKLEHLSTSQARAQLTTWLRDHMVDQQFRVERRWGSNHVLEALVETAKRDLSKPILQDITQTLSYRTLLVGADLLAEHLAGVLTPGTERVGVLLPNINATPVVMLALWSLGRCPAVLNFSAGLGVMRDCAALAGLQQIITSRTFVERAKWNIEDLQANGTRVLYLEDLKRQIGKGERLLTAARISLNPRSVIRTPQHADHPAAILFTSGSEGTPKAVELTHANLMANIHQMSSVCDFVDSDRVFNCLPLFHSFGLTIGLFLPLVRGMYTFLYPSPLHYRVIPTVLYDRDCTVLLSTNTFLSGYARKANPYDFRSLRYLFAGAEKIQESTSAVWMRRFGVRVLEGYGATECSPCLSINTPMMNRVGTVGRLLPGIECRLETVEGVTGGGRLFVKGPNIMRRYLNPEPDAKFQSLGGWYDTGDIVQVDPEGYISIQGRLKRFAKISGEMVSLAAIEDSLSGAFPQYGLRFQAAVVSQPDENKGEKLIVVSNDSRLTIDEVRNAVRSKGLSNLCVPREVRFLRDLPKLGSGKINLRELERWVASN